MGVLDGLSCAILVELLESISNGNEEDGGGSDALLTVNNELTVVTHRVGCEYDGTHEVSVTRSPGPLNVG
jgi:hypothetical protein